jgi:cysteine desulfurase
MIYLDYNATTPLTEPAKMAMLKVMDLLGNPSSVHKFGRDVRKVFEGAREQIAKFLNVKARNITFTSGATEANNLIINGFNGNIFIENTAHDSLLNATKCPQIIEVDSSGIINLEALEAKLANSKEPTLVAVMLVNNETGVIQPIQEILKICKRYNAHLHVDAVQAIAKIELDYSKLDSFSLSAHKFGGPKGIGAIVINKPLTLTPQIKGGGQERSLRAGTENLMGAVGMGAALTEPMFNNEKLTTLRDYLEQSIANISSEVVFFAKNTPRVSNTSAFALPGIKSEIQLMQFDTNGIAISSGAACSSGKVKTSHVLKAMGVDDAIAKCAIRVSMGFKTNKQEIDEFLKVWQKLYATRNNYA